MGMRFDVVKVLGIGSWRAFLTIAVFNIKEQLPATARSARRSLALILGKIGFKLK